jgi:hypothetical protein
VRREIAKVKMQTMMNIMVVKRRIRDVVKIREEKAVRMIVGKRIQVKEL